MILDFKKVSDVFCGIFRCEPHFFYVIGGDAESHTAQDHILPGIPHAKELREKGPVAQKRKQHITRNIILRGIPVQPSRVLLLRVHRCHPQEFIRAERLFHRIDPVKPVIKI